MRSHNVMLLIALVTFSFSNAFEFTNLAEVKALRASAYGNSLIETISLTLQNAGSIEEVKNLLEDLLFKLNKDQEKADSDWKETDKKLSTQIQDLDDQISSLEKDIAKDDSELKKVTDSRDKSQKNIEQYTSQKKSNDLALKDNEEKRSKDIDLHAKSVREHNDVVNAIEQVLRELSKLKDSISGEGKPVHVEEIANETRDREYKALQNSFLQMTKDKTEAMLFVEMATAADQDALTKLISLLEDIKRSTEVSLNRDEKAEENSKKAYEELKAALNTDNSLLIKNIEIQDASLKKYNETIDLLNKTIEDNKKLRESRVSEKETTDKLKKQKLTQFTTDSEERNREKAVIEKLKQIVKERLENMSKFLRSSTDG